MTQQSTLALAKQGNIKAIKSVANYLLKDKDIKARASIKNDCLFLVLESSIPLEIVSTKHTIRVILHKLAIANIATAKVTSRLENSLKTDWVVDIDLKSVTKSETKAKVEKSAIAPPPSLQASNSPQGQPVETKENSSNNNPENQQKIPAIAPKKAGWSPWFPYPSSWLRTLGLIMWLTIVVTITNYWGFAVGIIMASILNDLILLFKIVGLSFAISIIVFAYINHFLFGKKSPRYNY